MRGVVTRTRIEGTRGGSPWGIVTLSTDAGEVSARDRIDVEVGNTAALRVTRYVAFTDNVRVGEGEIV